jgi:DNA polymerase (family 10)
MAKSTQALGKEYFGICDHSKSAFYANGLSIERVLAQHTEIDKLNQKFDNFKIFKGIESDILSDGSLDYPDEILATFDFIVASVHSVLRMDEERATTRLIKAVENPYTTILGHPSTRLLLSRKGFPINYPKLIDACAANGVSIELNAHPYRLDIDWRLLPLCVEKGVKIAINPDSHRKEGLSDIRYGVLVAQKAGLRANDVLNNLSLQEFSKYINK